MLEANPDLDERLYAADRFQPHEVKPWIRRFLLVGGGCTIFSAFVTLRGVQMVVGEVFFPVGWTLLSALISFLLFAFLCHTIPRASPEQRGALLLGVAVPALLLVGATSTVMGLEGAAGPEAQLLELQRLAEEAEHRVETMRRERLRQLEATDTLRSKKTQFEALGKGERGHGDFTGHADEGKTSRDLQAIAEALGMAADRLDQNQKRRLEAEEKAGDAAARMRWIAESTQASPSRLPEAADRYQQELRRFNTAYAELQEAVDVRDVLAPIREALARQEMTPPTARTQDGRERQQEAAANVRALGQAALEDSRKAVEPPDRDEFGQEEPLRIPRPFTAIRAHFWEVIHLAAFPLALDFLYPIVALVALTFMRGQVRMGSSVVGARVAAPSPATTSQESVHVASKSPHNDVQERLEEYRQRRDRLRVEPDPPR
jgi:hypothetical protein